VRASIDCAVCVVPDLLRTPEAPAVSGPAVFGLNVPFTPVEDFVAVGPRTAGG